jgi:hypothetical protein
MLSIRGIPSGYRTHLWVRSDGWMLCDDCQFTASVSFRTTSGRKRFPSSQPFLHSITINISIHKTTGMKEWLRGWKPKQYPSEGYRELAGWALIWAQLSSSLRSSSTSSAPSHHHSSLPLFVSAVVLPQVI